MTDRSEAAESVALATKLEHWAKSTGSASAHALVVDATDLYRAAKAYVDAVDQLVAKPEMTPAQHAKLLTTMQIWLYDELEAHLLALKSPLDATIGDLYERTS